MFYELTDAFEVSADLQRTWAFFSSAGNLPTVTPPWLKFTIQSQWPIHIEQDTLLDYTIAWSHIPIRWRTKIIDWQPPHRFTDLQLRRPYSFWHHTHAFAATGEATLCTDRVIYKLPSAFIGRLAHSLVVRRQLLDIFQFRRKAIAAALGWVRAVQPDVKIATLS